MLLLITRCTDPYKGLKLPEEKEYNQIICGILEQDTTLIKDIARTDTRFVCSELYKIQIKFMSRKNDTADRYHESFPANKTYIYELNGYEITNATNRIVDSLYFAFQNESAKIISINEVCNSFIKLTTPEIDSKSKSNVHFGYIQFSLPILNSKQNRAFVKADFYEHAGGQGMTYILEKRNNKWKLLFSKMSWVT